MISYAEAKLVGFKKASKEFQILIIRAALAETGGIKARAAKLLGMQRTTLVERMRALGMREEKSGG